MEETSAARVALMVEGIGAPLTLAEGARAVAACAEGAGG